MGRVKYRILIIAGMLTAGFLVFITMPTHAVDVMGLKLEFKYGKLKRSSEVNKIFQNYQILPGYRYYSSGLGEIPYAIIGIQDSYKLRKGLWREVQVTKPLLRSWVYQMDNLYGYPPYGFKILDNKGKQVGIWYSSKQWTTVIIEDENQIAVFTPEPPGFRGEQ